MRLQLDAPTEADAMQHAQKARAELREAGIEDDVDAILGGDEEGELHAVGTPLDFQAVSEFYEPGGRRPGTQPITPRSLALPARTVGGSTALADAVRASTARQAVPPAGPGLTAGRGEEIAANVQAALP
jgi:hypothetical protein